MVLESLSDSLRGIIRKVSGASYIDKDTIKEVTKDIAEKNNMYVIKVIDTQ